MCLAVLKWSPGSDVPLTVVANRDEFRQRPTQAMSWWQDDKILAGKDLQAGGTWLGFNRAKKFALLTNIRPGFIGVTKPLSRGQLVSEFLQNDFSIESYQQKVLHRIDQYGGFNLILFDTDRLFWFSSTNPEGKWLAEGVHGLSNDALDTPWPKVDLAKEQMRLEAARLLEPSMTNHRILLSPTQANDADLPETGVPKEWEQLLSAQTITGSDYGTRSRTHITMDCRKKYRVTEQQVIENGTVSRHCYFEF